MNKQAMIIIFFLFFLLVGCGGSDKPIEQTPIPVGQLTDLNEAPNEVSERALVNDIEVGITVFAENALSYQLLDSAVGRFTIDEKTGVVYLADYLLLNANLIPKHSIEVQALGKAGAIQSETFDIVVIPNKPISGISDSNLGLDEILEGRHTEAKSVGITAKADDPDDQVLYQLSKNPKLDFIIGEKDGVVTTKPGSQFSAISKPSHVITVEAASEDGSMHNKDFDIKVLNNYENDIPLANKHTSLLNWDAGQGQVMEGWEWSDNIAYGNPGWLLANEGPHGGNIRFKWGEGARSFNKSGRDKKQQNTAYIDLTDKAPSTSSGGSLKIVDKPNNTVNRSTWWVWYDGKPLSERGVTNSQTDRMSFYMKAEGLDGLKDNGGKSSIRDNFHIGTYLCWDGKKTANGTGDGCPYEGPGNQHYYHYLAINPNAWIHVLLDQHPQHIRGGKGNLKNNPSFQSHKKNYFEHLNQFYFDIKVRQKNETSLSIDELKFFSTKDMLETNQNDESITSLWVGYWPDKEVWELGFQDSSYGGLNDNTNSTYEIRWSTSPISNDNFESANPIIAEFYSGVDVTGVDNSALIRRQSGWRTIVWTRFELSQDVEDDYLKVFFAVRDVSRKGAHKGTKWPYTFGDGHDAPTSNIKIIDYYLRPPQR